MRQENKTETNDSIAGASRISLGRRGEETAVAYLKRSGYDILFRNFRCRLGEIDIVASDRAEPSALAAIEIKTRRSLAFGLPCESVTPEKRRKIARAAAAYAAYYGLDPDDFRIDIIEILYVGDKPYIRHLKNVF